MIYALIGPPGSGKSLQAELLAKALRIPKFSLGQVIRETTAGEGATLARINSGDFIPDKRVTATLRRLHQQGQEYILDGIPRTAHQVKIMTSLWGEKNIAAIILVLPRPMMVDRIALRRDKVRSRPDDQPAVMARRWRLYHRHTSSLLAALHHGGIRTFHIDGTPGPNRVAEAILHALR